jgi:hypothetical protein
MTKTIENLDQLQFLVWPGVLAGEKGPARPC